MSETNSTRTQTIERPVEAGPQRRVWHYFPGYDDPMAPPPPGAVSLCGYVRRGRSAPGVVSHFGTPDACIVCEDLAAHR